jgi:hypothetical protein
MLRESHGLMEVSQEAMLLLVPLLQAQIGEDIYSSDRVRVLF